MGQYKEMVHKLPEDREIMEMLTDITDNFVESVKITQPQKYANLINKMKEISEEGHFTKDHLEHIDHGHFSTDFTTKLAEEIYEIDFTKEHFNEYDFNFIMNEMHKLFHPVYHDKNEHYAELAIAWLDHNKGKAYKYYEKMYK